MLILPAALLTGCGNSRTRVPSLEQPATPHGFRQLAYPDANLKFDVPTDWLVFTQQAPLIATVTSGTATVALWRYVRPNPAASAGTSLRTQLRDARAALIASAKARAPHLRVIRTQIVRLAGLPGVVLDATERISGNPRRVRSIHLFAPGLEVVIEEYAPPAIFHAVDHAVFSPLKQSLALIFTSKA